MYYICLNLFLEGQRKAKFELCGIEKKKNTDRINQLKNELKQLCTSLGKPFKVYILLEFKFITQDCVS